MYEGTRSEHGFLWLYKVMVSVDTNAITNDDLFIIIL